MNGEHFPKHYIPLCQVRLVRDGSITTDRKTIKTPDDAYQILKGYFCNLPNEHFVALLLDTKNHVRVFSPVSIGSLNASIVHPRELFQRAILGCIVQNSSTYICNRRIPKVAEKKCRCLQQCRKTNAS